MRRRRVGIKVIRADDVRRPAELISAHTTQTLEAGYLHRPGNFCLELREFAFEDTAREMRLDCLETHAPIGAPRGTVVEIPSPPQEWRETPAFAFVTTTPSSSACRK